MVKKNGSIEFKVKLRSFSPLGNVVKFCQGRQMVCIWGSQMFSDCTGLLSLSMQHLPASEMQLVFRSIRVDLKIQLLVFLLLGRIDNSLLFHKSMYNMRWPYSYILAVFWLRFHSHQQCFMMRIHHESGILPLFLKGYFSQIAYMLLVQEHYHQNRCTI